MIQRLLWGTLYGLAFMFITGAVLFSVLDDWPSKLMWLKIGAGLSAQFGLGVFTYMRDPEGAWKVPPTITPRIAGKVIVILLAVGVLSACGTPQVSMPMGAAAVAWGDTRATYATGSCIATQLRQARKIDDQMWEELKGIDAKAKVYRTEIERALLNPNVPVDYEKIMQYSSQAIDLLLKLGITVAK